MSSLEQQLTSIQQQIDMKLGAQEAHFALGNKLERSVGEALSGEMKAAMERLDAMSERASAAEVALLRRSRA